VDKAERRQVCELTSLLIVVAIAPSWGGIEVEMAQRSGVPAVILIPAGKKVSRLLRGNPAAVKELEYETFDQALTLLRHTLSDVLRPAPNIPSLLPCS